MGKGRSGKTTTTRKTDIGTAIKIINMGETPQYCTETGSILPKRGFAWEYKEMLFISKGAALDYEYKINPPQNDQD
jgi:hypothetical protein